MHIVGYSNCQFIGIHQFLKRKLNATYTHLANYKYIKNKDKLPVDLLRSADVFIFQFTNKQHGIYSTDPTSELNVFSFLRIFAIC